MVRVVNISHQIRLLETHNVAVFEIAHGSFMQDWNTDMRYAPDGAVVEARAIIWRDQADALFGHILF